MNTAKAHCRTDRKFSAFHESLISKNPNRDFALKHLYNLKNTMEILARLGWSKEEIKDAEEHISIDVWYYVVRIHIPKWIQMSGTGLYRPVRSLSRFISKNDFINVVMDFNMRTTEFYEISATKQWDVLKHQDSHGNCRMFLKDKKINCTCRGYGEMRNAFVQDKYAGKCLMKHSILQGQIPDKHVFRAWQYLQCHSKIGYCEVWKERKEAAIAYSHKDWDQVSDEEVFAAAEQAKKDLGFAV